MLRIAVSPVAPDEVGRLEAEFNERWPWPRRPGFVGRWIERRPYFVARDGDGRYLGHCHVRRSQHPPFVERGIPEISDLNVMPDSRRRGAATALLDGAEAHIASTSAEAGIAVGTYEDYGPAQRLYSRRGYVPDGTGVWWGRRPVRGGDVVTADDALVLYLTKPLR